MYDHAIQFICGCLSGWAQVLTMQPFQIIKVRLANQSLLHPMYSGIRDCIHKIYQQEGPFAFYKGTSSPLIGIGALVSLQFGTNEFLKKMIKRFHLEDQTSPRHELAMKYVWLSGLITGIPSALVVTPVDHTRIKMQAIEHVHYKSAIDAGLTIFHNHGIRGLYQGFNVTVVNEVLSLGVYFGSYEYLLRKFNTTHTYPPSTIVSFFAGGFAGSLCWFFTYPIDYIKTIIQSDDTQNRKYKSATRAVIMQYQEEGIRTFVKGLGITMIRSFPVNGVGFVTFQYFKHKLERKVQI